jgi:acyl-[acyl-carrier-protein]-phospholipid O-acyltransferase/long-chain-fatty-acid--[acyl-carrier-protein] ligase
MTNILNKLVLRLLSLRYDITVKGLDKITDLKGILFLPNHPALIDPVIVVSVLNPKFSPNILVDENQLKRPGMGLVKNHIKMNPIPDVTEVGVKAKENIKKALKTLADKLKDDENVLLYPGGRIYREKNEQLPGTSGVSQILKMNPKSKVVLLRTTGLWGSRLSWGYTGKHPQLDIKTIFSWIGLVLANFIFFMPKRKIEIEVFEPNDFPYNAEKNVINQYLEDFYNKKIMANTFVPYHFLKGSTHQTRPEPEINKNNMVEEDIPNQIKEDVIKFLKETTNINEITLQSNLNEDLGLDSLSKVEIMSWLQSSYGHAPSSTDDLLTAYDIALTATGNNSNASDTGLIYPISQEWLKFKKNLGNKVEIEKLFHLTDYFIKHLKSSPHKKIIGDQVTGEKSYQEIATAVFLLKPVIEKFKGDKIGIMLPATNAGTISYLSTLFGGKIPVMVNWTLGNRNLNHSVKSLNINKILTSKTVIKRLEAIGESFSGLEDHFCYLEDIFQNISIIKKLSALLKAKFFPGLLSNYEISKYSAILFTSGSESLPKAVPLTHHNHISNISGILDLIAVKDTDCAMGFLPPFHSFGLAVNIILPFCLNIPVSYHANPTEGAKIAALIKSYNSTFLAATPTFLKNILSNSQDGELESLRFVVAGAEKCPEALFNLIKEKYPDLKITEGYGITECSPVISANPLEKIRPGSIGKILNNIEYALVHPESFKETSQGEESMLLVRGPSIFEGYLNFDGPSPFVKHKDKDWYNTGDLVKMDTDGYLHFAGRLKRFVKIAGEMISLPLIEEVLSKNFNSEDDQDGPVLAVDAIESEGRTDILLITTIDIPREEANKVIRSNGLTGLYNIQRTIKIDAIPLLGTGKTDYQSLKKYALENNPSS